MSSTEPPGAGYLAPAARPISDARRDVLAGAKVVAALAVIGALLGLAWIIWSPTRPLGFVPDHGSQWLPGEDESAIATDGRFLILTLGTGVLGAIAVWSWRRLRGPIAAAALVLGGLVGAQVTRLVGYLFGGGSTKGPECTFYLPDPVNGQCVKHIKLAVHTPALYLVEAGTAVLVYALCTSFAVRDDLGRRDPLRLLALRRRAEHQAASQPPPEQNAVVPDSVGRGTEAHDAGRYSDRPGGAQ